ncbi:MAG: hypothetical protein WC966_09235 [Bradymonadales bacterium]|jgi:hypothetical protein
MDNFSKLVWRTFILMVSLLCFVGTAAAQDEPITIDAKEKIVDDKEAQEKVAEGIQRESGWYPKLRIGGTASLNYNKDVVDVIDGTAFTFGLFIKGGLDYVYKNFEWINNLDIEHQQTKTPSIESWIKSVDKFDFRTLVLFRIPKVEWLGPFARFRLQTSLFPGYYITDKDIMVRYYSYGTSMDDKTDLSKIKRARMLAAQDSIKVTSAGEPLVLTESIGLFINPYSHDLLTVTFKAGAAGQHLFADGGYVAFDKDDKDPFYDLIELKTTHSLGVEGELELKGIFTEYANWSLLGNLYYPFLTSKSHGLKGAELIHSDIEAKISVKISSWASLDYALTARLRPFITEKWQINNTILLNIGFDVFY